MSVSPWRRRRTVGSLAALILATATLLLGNLTFVSADQGLSRDPSFGSGGRAVVADVSASVGLFDMASQSDGRVLVAVVGGDSFIRRYRANGVPDPTFALGGTLGFPISNGLAAWSLPSDPAKPIMVLLSTATEGSYLLRRYLASGVLDTTYGTAGEISISFGQGSTRPLLAVSTTGAVTLVTSRSTFSTQTTTLQRFNSAGTVEFGFGTGGTATLDGVSGEPLGVDGSGVMLLVHTDRFDFTTSVVRVTAAGSVDATYGVNGFARLHGNIDHTFAVAHDDGAVTATSRQYDGGHMIRVERLMASGTPDNSFGNAGITDLVFRPFQPNYGTVNSNESAVPRNIVALDNGRVGVLLNSFGVSAAAILRADGSPDPRFGVDGQAILSNDLQLVSGDISAAGRVHFLGAAPNSAPLYLQRSLDNAPWPPTSPAPTNLTVSVTVDGAGNVGLRALWSPVVNPDPEVFDFVYDVGVALRGHEPFLSSAETTEFKTFPLSPGTYIVTVRSRNAYGAGHPATASITIPDPSTPAAGPFLPATRLSCVSTATSAPLLTCPGAAGS